MKPKQIVIVSLGQIQSANDRTDRPQHTLDLTKKDSSINDLGLRLFLQKPVDKNGLTQMDIQIADPNDWLQITDLNHYKDETRLKRDLFNKYPNVVSASQNNLASQQGEQSVLEMVAQTLVNKYPQYFMQNGNLFRNLITGENIDLQNLPRGCTPLDVASQMVHEDFILMHREKDGDPYKVVAASFYFPSAWSPRSKLGLTMQEVHAPVKFKDTAGRDTSINTFLGRSIDHALAGIKSDRPLWRMNMLIHSSPQLFRSTDVPESLVLPEYSDPLTVENTGDRLWLRLEQQLFLRVPQTNDVLFSVRTFVYPFKSLSAETAAHVANILRQKDKRSGMSIGNFLQSEYKGWTKEKLETLLQYLDQKTS